MKAETFNTCRLKNKNRWYTCIYVPSGHLYVLCRYIYIPRGAFADYDDLSRDSLEGFFPSLIGINTRIVFIYRTQIQKMLPNTEYKYKTLYSSGFISSDYA